LLKVVKLKNGISRLYPYKVYCHNSVIANLPRFLQRSGFVAKLEIWRNRNIPNGFLADVFDGQIWKEWQYVDGQQFLAKYICNPFLTRGNAKRLYSTGKLAVSNRK
jgi:hypothetical protein